MVRCLALVFVLGLLVAAPAPARDAHPDRTADVILTLFSRKVEFDPGTNVNDMSLIELTSYLSKKYGVTFSINRLSFQSSDADIAERKPNWATTNFSGLNLHQFLNQLLPGMGATYLVRNDLLEIVSIAYAEKVSRSTLETNANGTELLKEPLVSAIVKNESLTDVLDRLAARYDLSLSVSQLARDKANVSVSSRLLNVPADKALDLLAAQCDLQIVREGNAFLITTRENARTLLAERTEEKQKRLEPRKPTRDPSPKAPPQVIPNNRG